ncbi:alpha-2-macroglobulin family protein [Desertivirga xinjiangensis]|uniref:alpha-2-macroglobulin family protein n=1 Tax=Desertivirga xinjiangensis TaxID=539206 RepID=UPI00210D2215|nr:alpha-2-macroglobulin family protein [Pedobacter xinjiangensis]
MSKYFTLLLLLVTNYAAFAQKSLHKSRESSYLTYIYPLNEETVKSLLKNKALDERVLKNPVDSFRTKSTYKDHLPPGNYLKVFAEKNLLHYSLLEKRTASLKLLHNGKDLQFILLDREGNEVEDAEVTVNDRRIAYDRQGGLWRAGFPKKEQNLLRVFYQGVANYSIVEYKKDSKPFSQYTAWVLRKSPLKYVYIPTRSLYYRIKNGNAGYRSNASQQQLASGYIVFNKPIYKPLDTVKLKAFLLHRKSHKPVDKEMEVRLSGNNKNKVLGTLKPVNKGSYNFEFPLHDSLKLELDRNYSISLYHKNKLFQAGSIRYEEYELKSITFNMRGAEKEHSRRQANSLYFKATDENGLNVLDGRVELHILTRSASPLDKESVFVPDTLWKHQFRLDPLGETKILLPDHIFPDADITYAAEATFLNSNNESRNAQEEFDFSPEPDEDLRFELRADSLHVSFAAEKGIKKAEVRVAASNTEGDTIETFMLTIPGAFKIDPNAEEYEFEGKDILDWFDFEDQDPRINASSRRTADSLFVQVANPHRISFWYTVLNGKKVVDRGRAIDLDYRVAWKGGGKADFRYSFIWGGETKEQSVQAQFAEKELLLDVQQPLAVTPGQKSEIELAVRDAKGQPVENVDITAFSITSKFDYNVPNIPYFGKRYRSFKSKPQLEEGYTPEFRRKLDWERWAAELGLDSIEYFRFTHPLNTYKTEEPAPDSITQIAPFLVSGGNILPVEILYIDGKPVYFSQAKQSQPYSFKVEPGLVNLKFRLAGKIVDAGSVLLLPGKKSIFSFNADPGLNKSIKIVKASPTLTDAEANVLNRYMISLRDTWSPRFATIREPQKTILLRPTESNWSNNNNDILVGPLSYNLAEFRIMGEAPTGFVAEPNYVYTFQPGLIKQTSIPAKYPFSTRLLNTSAPAYTQYVLRNNQVDSLWLEYLDLRSHTMQLFSNQSPAGRVSGRLEIKLKKPVPQNSLPLVKSILLYKNDNPDFLNIYRGSDTDLGRLDTGSYRLMLLLKGDSYLLRENVKIAANGKNLLTLDFNKIFPPDSTSIKIAEKIREQAMGKGGKDSPLVDNIKESFNQQFIDPSVYKATMSGRILAKSDKTALPGVIIKIKGTNFASSTDINGEFNIRVPLQGKLLINFIGFDSQELNIDPGKYLDIYLEESTQKLEEVVVVGYGANSRNSKALEQSLQGRLAGVSVKRSVTAASTTINIRGVGSISNQSSPLYIVDGIPVENALKSMDPSEISDLTTLKDDAAVAIYGARAANGVIIITTRKGKEKAEKDAAELAAAGSASLISTSLRTNFSDYAFWQPLLRTNSEGKTRFSVTFPDDITSWRTFFIAINGREQSGFSENSIKSFKPLSASFVSPAFVLAGDKFSPLGKIANYTTEPASVNREFLYNGQPKLKGPLQVNNSHIDTISLVAERTDSLSFRYSFEKEGGYSDGEERRIPVYPVGVLERSGAFHQLEGDTSLSIRFDPRLGEVKLRAEASVFPTLLQETERLRRYQYLCNEQLASKLKGLLLEKKIREHLKERFDHEREINTLIRKLNEGRKADGTWGWWKNSETELWISRHVLDALVEASKAGYKIPFRVEEIKDYLVYQVSSDRGMDKLDALLMLHKLDAKIDYKTPLGHYEKELKKAKEKVNIYEKLKLLYLQQKAGIAISADSLLQYKRSTMFGNLYFGNDSYRFFDNSIQSTVLAYHILREEGKHPALLQKIRNYFLEQRSSGEWRNTYESSLILEAIIPDVLQEGKKPQPAEITLSSDPGKTITSFPYDGNVKPGTTVQIKKRGDMPVYLSAYQEFWNSEPQKQSKDFRVDTWFENQSGLRQTRLKGGSSVTLKAEVTVKADAEYVMVEVPIPAGCSYEEKEQQSWWGPEIHREYFKNKVIFFCRKLKQGRYTFQVKLMPRYDGLYTLNPAKAEMMYFPVFYGREEMRRVQIGGR